MKRNKKSNTFTRNNNNNKKKIPTPGDRGDDRIGAYAKQQRVNTYTNAFGDVHDNVAFRREDLVARLSKHEQGYCCLFVYVHYYF